VARHDKRHVADVVYVRIVSTTLETMRDRRAGMNVLWRQFVVLFGIGAGRFGDARARFRATIGTMV